MRFLGPSQLSTDAVQRNTDADAARRERPRISGQTIRLAIPVSHSIVTNTMALVLLDQHNTDDRYCQLNGRSAGSAAITRPNADDASQRGDDGRRHRRLLPA